MRLPFCQYDRLNVCRAGGRRQPVGADRGCTLRGGVCLPCRVDSFLRYPLHLWLARGDSHRGRGARHLRARRSRLQLIGRTGPIPSLPKLTPLRVACGDPEKGRGRYLRETRDRPATDPRNFRGLILQKEAA